MRAGNGFIVINFTEQFDLLGDICFAFDHETAILLLIAFDFA